MTRLDILEITPELISDRRQAYLSTLPAAQEYYLETLVSESCFYALSRAGHDLGYLALKHKMLTELYLIPGQTDSEAKDIFTAICEQLTIETALCKAFDKPLLTLCRQTAKVILPVAWLFRDWLPGPDAALPTEVTCRLAQPCDRELIQAHHDDFFTDSEITRLTADQGLWLYFRQTQLSACGLVQPIVAGSQARDIGMVVSPSSRGSGLGLRVVKHLAGLCMAQGLEPVCGCSGDNQASRRTLDKAGFASRYALLLARF